MWRVLVQDMLEEENPDLYRKKQMDGTLGEYVKSSAAIMADAVKVLSPRGDPMSTSEAREIVIAEMRAEIRRGAYECEEMDMLDIKEVVDLGIPGDPDRPVGC